MIPDRYKIAAEALAVFALLIAIGWLYHWHCAQQQDIGEARIQAQWDKQKLTDAETYRLRSEANQTIKDNAITQGAQREAVIKTLAASSAASAAGMRETIAAFSRSNATATVETLVKRADTAGSLLGDCTERYRSVAEKADRHANDAATLSAAWPK